MIPIIFYGGIFVLGFAVGWIGKNIESKRWLKRSELLKCGRALYHWKKRNKND